MTQLALGTVAWKALRYDQAEGLWNDGMTAMARALDDEPDNSLTRVELDKASIDIADRRFQIGLWDEARGLLEQVFRRNPASMIERDGHVFYVLAMLKLFAGDEPGYRAVCKEFYKQFQNIDRRFNLYRAYWCGPSDPADLRALIPLVDADFARNPDDDWYNVHAAADSRPLRRCGKGARDRQEQTIVLEFPGQYHFRRLC